MGKIEINSQIAEIIGMFAVDGCLQPKYVCIWGNINQDQKYYDNVVCPLFSSVFKKKIVAHEKKSNSVYGFYLCGKNAVDFFKRYGFKVGNKTYIVTVPKIILNSKNPILYSSFIRGFADCDGFLNFVRRKQHSSPFHQSFNTYPRIYCVSVSKRLILDISYMLTKLNIKHAVETRRVGNSKKNKVDAFVVAIRGIDRLEEWIKTIGFKNPTQFTKYLVWKRYGFCPPNTTFKDREEMLAGNLNPNPFYKSGPDRI